jgi:hypothetical protein
MGEISFCAYNTGVGWRNIIEKMKANASVAEWYRTRGRHAVYAKNQDLPLPAPLGSIVMPASALRLQEIESNSPTGSQKRRLPLVPAA